jgi:hypothetical protein
MQKALGGTLLSNQSWNHQTGRTKPRRLLNPWTLWKESRRR